MEPIFKIPFYSGFGVYEISGTLSSITGVCFLDNITSDNNETLKKIKSGNYPIHLIQCFEELSEYFQGKLREFTTKNYIKLEGSDFQVKVWQKMMEIPYGKTVTYSELAASAGNEKACRSVGSICGKNNFGILVPCHRVLGKSSIGGFRYGIERKKILLDLEKKACLGII